MVKKQRGTDRAYVILSGLILLTALTLSACGSGSGGTTTKASDKEEFSIDSSGGVAEYTSTSNPKIKATLDFPDGAVSDSTTISVQLVDTFVSDPGVIAGLVFDFGPDGLQFSKPVQFTVTYDPAAIAGISPEHLRLYKRVGNGWQELPTTVDTNLKTLTAAINSFSTYAAGPEHDPPVTTASPAGGAYESPQEIILTCDDGSGSGCDKTYYTTDGSDPTTSSGIYSGGIPVNSNTTLKFFSVDIAGNNEGVKAEVYVIGGGGPSTYSIGATVSGLADTVVLQNNGADNETVTTNGPFIFNTPLPDGSGYSVTVLTQPTGQTCSVTNGSGTLAGADVTGVAVTCADNPPVTYSVGGTVSGLAGMVVLQNNGADNETVITNGPFIFNTPLPDGSGYSVTVLTQPTGQTCSVTNGSGTLAGADVTGIAVTCADNPPVTYSVGATVSGLAGTVVLQNNGGDDLTIKFNGSFAFATPLADGAAYSVTVLTQPTGQTCAVTNGSGTINGANITDVSVTCEAIPTYTVGGTVTGLSGTLELQNNATAEIETLTTNGPFIFETPLADGAFYVITVLTQPAGQNCLVANGSGTINGANVTDVSVTCEYIPPNAPAGVSATPGDGQVRVNWNAATGADSYNIYWNTTGGVTTSDNPINGIIGAPYQHTGLTNGTTYYYIVTAVNSAGESTPSSEVFATPASPGSGPTLQWTVQPGTSYEDRGHDIAVDSSGNVYATGTTSGNLDGNWNHGGIDIFITKYDTEGNRLWTVQPGTSEWDYGWGIAVDSSGSVYATGLTKGDLDGNTSHGDYDIFITKYDTDGNWQWTVQPGTSNYEPGYDVAVDSAGNVYATGYTGLSLDGNMTHGLTDIFITKYDTNGNRQWTVQPGTSDAELAQGIAVDSAGNVYATGRADGGLDGNTSHGGQDIFITKYDTSGNRQWTVQPGTPFSDNGYGIAVDSSGSVYATGLTQGDLDGNTSHGGDFDIFITKYDTDGNRLWTIQPGTSNYDNGESVAVDPAGNVYATGSTKGSLDGNTNHGSTDIFITKYGTTGGGLYSVGGAVTGVVGTFVLQNNEGDDLTINSDGPFTFATLLADGATYSVTVLTQPEGGFCVVTGGDNGDGSGTISGADVTNIQVVCSGV